MSNLIGSTEINLYGEKILVAKYGIPKIHPKTVEYEIVKEPDSITHFIVIDGELPRAEEVTEVYELAKKHGLTDMIEYQPSELHPYEVIYHFPGRDPEEPNRKVVLIEKDENDWFSRHNPDIVEKSQIARRIFS